MLDNIHLFSIVGSDPNKNHLYDQLTDKFTVPLLILTLLHQLTLQVYGELSRF